MKSDADDAFRFYGLLSGKICAKASRLTQDFEEGKLARFLVRMTLGVQ